MESPKKDYLPKTKLSLRIFAPNLNPDDIEASLGLTADHKHHLGDPIGKQLEHKYKLGMWLLNSKSPPDAPLETHLDRLLSAVEHKQASIRALTETATVDFYCALFWQTGFQLSPQILSRIASLGATFGVVVYLNDSEAQSSSDATSVLPTTK